MSNPQTRMAAHVARRDAAHPQIPQTVRGTILVGVQIPPPTLTSNFSYNVWNLGHWGATLSTFTEEKWLER